MIRNKMFPPKSALFPHLVKAKNQHQSFKNHLRQKNDRQKLFKCSELLLFLKRIIFKKLQKLKKNSVVIEFLV